MKTKTRSIAFAITVLAAVACVLAGCGSSPPGSSGQSITLYNGQHEQTTDSLVEGFEKQTGIKVNVRDDDEDTLADEIVTEGSRSPADVIYTENSPALRVPAEQGAARPGRTRRRSRTPRASTNSPQGDWVGVSARVSVLIYNPSLIKGSELPTHVAELAAPKYKGKLAFAAGETDFQPIVTSYARTYGEAAALKWLEGIKANAGGHIYPDNETIADEVNRGAVAFGVVNQYYWYRMRAELGASNVHSKITYFAPRDPGYVLDISGAGDPRSPPSTRRDAQKFLAFLVCKAGPGDHRALDQLRVPDRRRRQRQPRPRRRSTSCSRTRSRSRTRRRLDGDRAAAQGRAPVRRRTAEHGDAGDHRSGEPIGGRSRAGPARREPHRGGCSALSLAVAVVLVLPLAFLLVEASGAGASDGREPDLPLAHRDAAVEHRATHGRRDGPLRGHRHARGLVRRAHRPARPAGLGGARRRAARDPRLRRRASAGRRFHLGRRGSAARCS